MKSRKTISVSRGLTVVWLLVLLALMAWLAIRVSQAPVLDADLMSLLPAVERAPAVEAAADRFRERFERRVVLLVGASDFATARSAAATLGDSLLATGLFSQITDRQDPSTSEQAADFYLPLRFGLLSQETRKQIIGGDLNALERAIVARYFSPASGLSSHLIERDPLLLLPGFFQERASAGPASLELEDGFLVRRVDGQVFVLIAGTLSGSPFSFGLQDRLVSALEAFESQNFGQAEDLAILKAGAVFHAAAGSASAKSEISRVGLGALLGIILLYAMVFRTWRPLGLSLLSIAVGCLGGFAACIAVFGKVHLFTLVLGASLVGTSVDYSLHYFCDRFRQSGVWSSRAALGHVFPGITLGLVTSVIGFAGLLVAPFPGLAQMAVFSGTGLVFAYLCVLTIHPCFGMAVGSGHMARALGWSLAYGRFCRAPWGRRAWLGLATLCALGVLGIGQLEPRDDIRHLQTANARVLDQERRVRDLLGEDFSSQFFLVAGRDPSELLTRQEQLVRALRGLRNDGHLSGHVALSDFVPSPEAQTENRALLAPLIEGEDSLLRRIAARVGLQGPLVDRYVADFAQAPAAASEGLSDWLESPMAAPYRHLWLGSSGAGVIAAVGLRGVRHPAELSRLADPDRGITFVDHVGELSGLFGDIRRQAGWLILASYVVVALVLLLRYGIRGGLAVMVAPLAAAIASLGVQGLLGEPLTLFNILALLLVLGIGVDYGIFFRETGAECPSTLVAIALSTITTLLAFGLLALSATAAVHAFGLTILVGIGVAFLLSPVAGAGQRDRGRGL